MYNLFLALWAITVFIALPVLVITLIINLIKKKPKKKTAWALLICFVCSVVFVFGALFTVPEDMQTEMPLETKNQTTEKVESTSPTTDADDSHFKTNGDVKGDVADVDTTLVKTLTDAGYTLEHATQIAEVLNGVGIKSISIEKMTGKPEKGLNAVVCYPNGETERDRKFWFTTEDGVVFYAGFSNEDLYDTEQGGYLKKYSDVHVPEKNVDMNTYTALQAMAEKEVKKYLNYPSSADFGLLDWGVGRSDDDYKIVGKVTAKNAFGVEDELPFSVWFKKTNAGFTVVAVAIDGQRVK